MRKFIISFFTGILVFSLVLFGGEELYNRFKNDEAKTSQIEAEEEPEELTGEVTGLLIGIDGAEDTTSDPLRTDTIILGRVNFDTGQIKILSIPRDTRVNINGSLDKINHAYALGGKDLTIKTIEDFLDIDIDHYIKVEMDMVQELVDIIGGVELDVSQRMYYSDPTAKPPLLIDLQPGVQVLDGQKSHDYLRFRSYPDGDVGRVKAQQYFMREFIKQTLKPSNLLKVDKLVKAFYDNVETDLSLKDTLKYGWNAKKLDINNIKTFIIPGYDEYIDNISYWIYDPLETEKMVEDFKYGKPEIEEEEELEEKQENNQE